MQKPELEKSLGLKPDELTPLTYVLMQSIAQGGTVESIALALKVDAAEITEIIAETNALESRFDKAVAIIRIDATGGVMDRDYGWDDLERVVLQKLHKVANKINDPDTLTRIAVAANRAKRSTDAPASGGAGNRLGEGGIVILAGGDLGVMHLSLSHRVARQLAAPESAPAVLEGQPIPTGNRRGMEMLRLADIRTMAEDIKHDSPGQESAGESVVEEKRRIKVDSSLVDDILGREYS